MFCYIILLVCYLISTVCGQVFFAIVWFAAWQGRTFLTTTLHPKHLKLYVSVWILITLSSVHCKTACKKTLLFLCLSIEPSDNFLEFFCRPAAGVVQHNVTSHISIASSFQWGSAWNLSSLGSFELFFWCWNCLSLEFHNEMLLYCGIKYMPVLMCQKEL